MPAPEEPLCVIGDVHGCFTRLENLLSEVPQGYRIILVGDYVDRGERSADVLRLISERDDFTCLKGNHEDMLLRFLKNPAGHGHLWLRNGGLQTLASFGVSGVRSEMNAEELQTCRDKLKDAMGERLCNWLSGLRTWVMSGNVLITHAGADPGAPPGQQAEKTLLWGHPGFLTTDRQDGIWVVHGHTIVDAPMVHRGRISIDTGAFATGILTAVCLDGTEPRFIYAGV